MVGSLIEKFQILGSWQVPDMMLALENTMIRLIIKT